MGDDGLTFLHDVVVLDLGDEATALAGEYLAELGATVVRVEDERGDVLRRRGGHWHAVHNVGKRSVAIDTTSDAAWDQIATVLPGVDVVIGPLEPNPATARFLDRLRTRDDGRIGFVDVVFRRDGPPEAVTDLTVGAAGGFTVLNGVSDDPPNHAAGDLAFKQTALAAAEAAMALVTARRRTGRAGHIVVSAQEAVVMTTMQSSNGNLHHWHGIVPSRHVQIAGGSTVLSKDDQWTSFAIHPPHWPRFVDWVERDIGPTGLADPEWSDPVHVSTHRGVILDVIERLAAATTRAGPDRGRAVPRPARPAGQRGRRRDEGRSTSRRVASSSRSPNRTARPCSSPARRSAPAGGAAGAAARPSSAQTPTSSRPSAPACPRPGRRTTAPIRTSHSPASASSTSRGRSPDRSATRLLADLGADVVKIESENRLDPIRHIGPQPTDVVSLDTNGVFQDAGAGKRAVTINVDTPEGRDLVRRLIPTADVVTANFTPDRLDRWGFDRASLEALRPDLVVANLAVMGISGPDAGWRSYGNGLVAMSGIAAHTGFEGRVPQCLGTMHTDFTVPYFAAVQILAVLHHRDRTGEGVYLELSQYESSVRLMDVELADVLNGGAGPGRVANRSPWCAPHGVYPAAGDDRWVAIACRDDDERVGSPHSLGVSRASPRASERCSAVHRPTRT